MPAITDAYTDALNYRATIGMTKTNLDTQINAALLALSRLIDRRCDRILTGFSKDNAATSRIFYPNGFATGDPEAENPWAGMPRARYLDVDEMAAVPTSVLIDLNRQGTFAGYTALTNPTDAGGMLGGDYQCFPRNANVGPEPKPWTQLYIPSWSKQNGWWPGCMVQVTTIYGYPAIPAAIIQGLIQLAAILRIENPRATMQVAEGVDVAVGASPEAKSIVDELVRSYKRQRLFA